MLHHTRNMQKHLNKYAFFIHSCFHFVFCPGCCGCLSLFACWRLHSGAVDNEVIFLSHASSVHVLIYRRLSQGYLTTSGWSKGRALLGKRKRTNPCSCKSPHCRMGWRRQYFSPRPMKQRVSDTCRPPCYQPCDGFQQHIYSWTTAIQGRLGTPRDWEERTRRVCSLSYPQPTAFRMLLPRPFPRSSDHRWEPSDLFRGCQSRQYGAYKDCG